MVGHFKFVAFLATMAGLACQPVLGDQKPSHMCPSPGSNLVNGFGTECDVVTINGLKGHSASQILYEIITESTLSDDTVFRNGSHVTCLFQETSFALTGAGIGVGPLQIQIPDIKHDGALCLFVADVPEGGLNLGEIRQLTKTLILKNGCGMCGKISANYVSQNETQKGWLRINWAKNAVCLDDCIDPTKLPLVDPGTVNGTSNATLEEGKKSAAGGLGNGWGTLSSVLFLAAMVAFL